MNVIYPFQTSPRCTATSKRTGKPCRAPAVHGSDVCYHHGARGSVPPPNGYPYHLSPRCTATSKRTGKPCQAPAVTGWNVCRFHGARGGRPATHGHYTKEAIAARRALGKLLRESRDMLADL